MKAIDAIRSNGQPFYLISTGGGAGIQGRLWNTPGISDVLLGAEFPYAKEATDACLGFEPGRYVVPETAIDLAMTAFFKAVSSKNPKPLGVGLTAAVASNRTHRGDHRVFVATVSDAGCRLFLAELEKGEGPVQREKDGRICDTLTLIALIYGLGLKSAMRTVDAADEIASVLGSLKAYKVDEDIEGFVEDRFFERPFFTASGKREQPWQCKGFVLPGAFNPPHEGHHQLARAALREPHKCETTVTYAVTQKTPHKGALSVPEMLRRAKFLEGRDRKFTRNDPLYIDKARQNPGAAFIVGVDAVERLFDCKWLAGTQWNVETQLGEFERLGTRFYVAGREVEGKFRTLADVPVPGRWTPLFQAVPGRWDYSSAALRGTP